MVEAMVGTTLFAVVAVGITAGLIQARRMAEINVWQITATTVAQSYVEQMKNMEYVELSYDPIPTKLSRDQPDPLVPDQWNLKLIDINDTPDDEGDDLRMWIRPRVTEVTSGQRRFEIILDYRWAIPMSAGREAVFEDSIHTIRSHVPTY